MSSFYFLITYTYNRPYYNLYNHSVLPVIKQISGPNAYLYLIIVIVTTIIITGSILYHQNKIIKEKQNDIARKCSEDILNYLEYEHSQNSQVFYIELNKMLTTMAEKHNFERDVFDSEVYRPHLKPILQAEPKLAYTQILINGSLENVWKLVEN